MRATRCRGPCAWQGVTVTRHETIRSVTGGPRGNVQHVMASLSQGELSDEERTAFNLLDFGEADDPIQPDWSSINSRFEKGGIVVRGCASKTTYRAGPAAREEN